MGKFEQAASIAAAHSQTTPERSDWTCLRDLSSALEQMANEGAIVVGKIDVGRQEPGDSGRYTVVISGGLLGDDYFRRDSVSLSSAVSDGILFYDQLVWKTNPPGK